MKTVRFLAALLLAPGFACSDPQCGEGELKVADTCKKLRKDADASTTTFEADPIASREDAKVPNKNKLDGGFDAGHWPDGSEARDPSCRQEGALRCAPSGGAAERERCELGAWIEAEPCEGMQLCDPDPEASGSCRLPETACVGSAGIPVCDGKTMRFCDSKGIADGAITCATASHCQRGLTSGACATCLPGEHRCVGAELEACAADGQGYEPLETCETAALCNATSGSCSPGCKAGEKTCQGDVLRACKSDLTGFADEETCEPGLCDITGKQCDICVPMSKKCEGNAISTCNAEGRAYAQQPCAAPKDVCTGNGVCVECTATKPCAAPANSCMSATCDVSNGTCGTAAKRAGTSCPAGVCDGQGECVQCVEDSNCAGVSGKGKCSDNKCVACVGDADCGSGKTCEANACVDKVVCGDGVINGDEQCDTAILGTSPYDCVNEAGRCKRKTLYTSCATSNDCDTAAGEVCVADSLKVVYVCSKACNAPGRTGVESGCPTPPNGLVSMCRAGFLSCMAAGCTRDADCAPGLTCFTDTDMPFCIGCQSDADCGSGTCVKPVSTQKSQDGYCR